MELLYPPSCVLCGKVLPTDSGKVDNGETLYDFEKVCETCKGKIKIMEEPTCMKCGKMVESPLVEYCHDCENSEFTFLRNRSVFPYTGTIRKAMHDFKYAHRKENALFFGQAINNYLGEWMKSLQVDAVIPVPLHKKRKRRRGYNQALLLAEIVGRYLDVPVDANILTRYGNTKPQKELGRKERKINLEKAFKISQNELQYYRVLLIDDIYTTGATLEGAAGVLKAAGVEEIYCVTACVGRGY